MTTTLHVFATKQEVESLVAAPSFTNTLLLSSLPGASAVGAIIFKVKDWDPTLHPRGYKGMFLETPDKRKAETAAPGDVIVSKAGKVFKVEKQTPKGVKVNPVDPDSGEIKTGYTVLANATDIAVFEGGKGPGTRHAISDLTPGTFIQHPKSQKRFVVSKHGNWTTVFPVDANGDVAGKHTVLPPTTEVIITTKQVGGQVTAAQAAQVHHTSAPAVPATPGAPPTPAAPSSKKLSKPFEQGDLVEGIKASNGVDVGEQYEIVSVTPDGSPVVTGGVFGNTPTTIPADHVKQTGKQAEILPQNLKRPPRPYAAGVGRHSAIVITERPQFAAGAYRSKLDVLYDVKRVPNDANPSAAGDVLGTYTAIGHARKQARQIGESHEAVIEQRAQKFVDVKDKLVAGDWVIQNGIPEQIAEIVPFPPYAKYGDYSDRAYVRFESFDPNNQRSAVWMTPESGIVIGGAHRMDQAAAATGYTGLNPGQEWLGRYHDLGMANEDMIQAIVQLDSVVTTVRPSRENLYLPALQSDWDPDELIGKSKGDALKTLRKLGYGEIYPREPNVSKYTNAHGKRLHVYNKNGVITSVDEIQTQATQGGGAGFHRQLQAVLDGGGDLEPLNPAHSAYEEERTSHARQILWDMAHGKQIGVEKLFGKGNSTLKVKADAAYRAEFANDTTFPTRAGMADQVEDPGLNIPIRPDVMDKWPAATATNGFTRNGTDIHIPVLSQSAQDAPIPFAQALIAAGERNGIRDFALDPRTPPDLASTDIVDFASKLGAAYQEWNLSRSGPLEQLDPTVRDYLTSTMQDVSQRAQRQVQHRETEVERRLDGIYEKFIADKIAERRKAEGTVPSAPGGTDTFEIPLWDDIEMEKQDIWEVDSLIQNAPKYAQVPFFVTGGLLNDGVLYGMRRSGKSVVHGRVGQEFDQVMTQRLVGAVRETNSKHPRPQGSYSSATDAGTMLVLRDGNKSIEYVPHGQGQSAPTNQRGRLTLEGYTPEEATQKLKDLGIIHELEEEVPFTSIFRAKRRYGVVSPLHSDYVSGQAPLPDIPSGISHGMYSSNIVDVLQSGGLLPIAQRFIVGIPLQGTIPANDVRNGVDHVVFGAMSPHEAHYGDLTVLYKDSAYLRRDVLITDRAFGTGSSRYPMYRKYHNKHRRAAGEKEHDKNIYEVLSPAARQAHIRDRLTAARSPSGLSASQNEWDMVGGVPIEDMAAIVIRDSHRASEVNRLLDQKLARGEISERPVVVSSLDNLATR